MYDDILLAIDLAEESSWKKSLPTAVKLAQDNRSRLHIMTVVPNFSSSLVGSFFPKGFEKEALGKVKDQLKAFVKEHVPEGIKVQHIVGHGTVYDEILLTAEKIKPDLIGMASHRPSLEDYLLGPNAARVVRHAKCSVFVVRG